MLPPGRRHWNATVNFNRSSMKLTRKALLDDVEDPDGIISLREQVLRVQDGTKAGRLPVCPLLLLRLAQHAARERSGSRRAVARRRRSRGPLCTGAPITCLGSTSRCGCELPYS